MLRSEALKKIIKKMICDDVTVDEVLTLADLYREAKRDEEWEAEHNA